MSMFVAIYFNSRLSTPRDEIEDLLEDALGDQGEVTGGGTGLGGSNIDLEITSEMSVRDVLELIRAVLGRLKTPSDTEIAIEEESFPLYEDQ